jgi:16S rRNA (cytidine1402-2'-O)-methyltransferase
VLYLVPTPLGNLRDVTLRAMDILSTADVVAAEDTRRTGQLMALLGTGRSGRMVSCHEHNEAPRAAELVAELAAGRSVALATNAGMPCVSDPGFRTVRAAVEHGFRVEALPGPSVVTTALAASGLPTHSFAFMGFCPKKPGARAAFLADIAVRRETVIFFEGPARLGRTLAEAALAAGADRRAVVAREISKLHEEHVRGTLGELAGRFAGSSPKGEITVLVAGTGG